MNFDVDSTDTLTACIKNLEGGVKARKRIYLAEGVHEHTVRCGSLC